MGFLIHALHQLLFVHVALQCYQPRSGFADQGAGDFEITYRELNDEIDDMSKNLNLASSFSANGDSGTKSKKSGEWEAEEEEPAANQQEVSKVYDNSGEKRVRGQLRRANAKKRRMSKREKIRHRRLNRLKSQNDGSADTGFLENSENEEPNQDHETAHYYLTKTSDIANMSVVLGPGPIPIEINDPTTTPKPTTSSSSPVISNITTKSRLNYLKSRSIVNLDDDSYLASFKGEHRKGHKRKLKINKNEMEADMSSRKKPMKENRMFHKQYSSYKQAKIHPNIFEQNNKRLEHKKNKHKNILDEAVNTRKEIEKYHLNEEEQYTNLSVINKSFQSAAGRKFIKSRIEEGRPANEEWRNPYHKRKEARVVVDNVRDEDAKKLCFLNAEREASEEEHTSLKDDTVELEKKNNNIIPRNNPRKGIKSKIDHSDWLEQMILLPLPDYSVRKNKTHVKNTLPLVENPKKRNNYTVLKDKTYSNQKLKKVKSVSTLDSNEKENPSLGLTSKTLKDDSESNKINNEIGPDTLSVGGGETKSKRDERNAGNIINKSDFKTPRERSIFSHHVSTSNENRDEVYDDDMTRDEQSYVMDKDDGEKNDHELSDKEDVDYEYDSKLSEDETITGLNVANKTILTTESTCVSTTECVQSIKPTTKPFRQRTTTKTNAKLQTTKKNGFGFGQVNQTINPYEIFLCGQLADDYVDEVLKRVKRARKISRELGFINETEETCDRCIELKPTKIPNLSLMKGALGKCMRNPLTVKNCSMCCGVPKPMMAFLNVLVYFEKENENSFYNKIEDDSSFIFTGDYPEAFVKSEHRIDTQAKYVGDKSSFNKDTFDKQHLREDMNEDKGEDKIASGSAFEKFKDKYAKRLRNAAEDSSNNGIDGRREREMENGIKLSEGRFGKNKVNSKGDIKFSNLDEKLKENNLVTGFNTRDPASLLKQYVSNKESRDLLRPFGINRAKSRKSYDSERPEIVHNVFNYRGNGGKKTLKNFDRYYGKSNYDYYKEYPSKQSPVSSDSSYKSYNGNSMTRNPFKKDSLDRNRYYNMKTDNRLSPSKDNYFDYNLKQYIDEKPKINQNINNRQHQSKYDSFSYLDSGEYSLYPSLDDKHSEEDNVQMLRNYKGIQDDNLRMVKRDTDPLYEDEPIVFEIPDIEYDLYK